MTDQDARTQAIQRLTLFAAKTIKTTGGSLAVETDTGLYYLTPACVGELADLPPESPPETLTGILDTRPRPLKTEIIPWGKVEAIQVRAWKGEATC